MEGDKSQHHSETMKNKSKNSTNYNRDNYFNHNNKYFVQSLLMSLPTKSLCTNHVDAKQITTGVETNTSDLYKNRDGHSGLRYYGGGPLNKIISPHWVGRVLLP
jgi:hypothetical protein